MLQLMSNNPTPVRSLARLDALSRLFSGAKGKRMGSLLDFVLGQPNWDFLKVAVM